VSLDCYVNKHFGNTLLIRALDILTPHLYTTGPRGFFSSNLVIVDGPGIGQCKSKRPAAKKSQYEATRRNNV